jgi:Ca-activated chloride channel family protein
MLPIVQRNHCVPGNANADVVLLIDTSDSMSGDKLGQAVAAASQFVELLHLPYDQAAVVGFNSQPAVHAGLTGDREVLLAALRSLTSGRGTQIDRALLAAASELQSRRRKARNRPIVILLSDGAHSGPSSDVVIAADRVRSAGAVIYTIGLGADVDQELLRAISGAGRYYFAPRPSDLAAIYAEIAVAIPCP